MQLQNCDLFGKGFYLGCLFLNGKTIRLVSKSNKSSWQWHWTSSRCLVTFSACTATSVAQGWDYWVRVWKSWESNTPLNGRRVILTNCLTKFGISFVTLITCISHIHFIRQNLCSHLCLGFSPPTHNSLISNEHVLHVCISHTSQEQ